MSSGDFKNEMNIDVCIMSTYHDTEDGRVFQKEARSLSEAGYRVVLLIPSQKKEYEKFGVEIIGFKKRRFLGRLKTVWEMFLYGKKLKAKIYHIHEAELLFAVILLKLFTACKAIYDVHEDHATSIPIKLPNPVLRKFFGIIIKGTERVLCTWCDAVIVVRQDLYHRFKNYGCPIVEEIMVCVQPEIFTQREQNILDMSHPVITHEGNLDVQTRGLDKYLQAAVTVIREKPSAQFFVIGRAPDEDVKWMEDFITAHSLEQNVHITGWVKFSEVPKYLLKSHMGILLLQPVSFNNMMGIPNKLFDYMAASIPVVACDFSNIGSIIREFNCGILVDPTNPDDIARAILELIRNPALAAELGKNGRRGVEEKYNWNFMERKLLTLYKNLLK